MVLLAGSGPQHKGHLVASAGTQGGLTLAVSPMARPYPSKEPLLMVSGLRKPTMERGSGF